MSTCVVVRAERPQTLVFQGFSRSPQHMPDRRNGFKSRRHRHRKGPAAALNTGMRGFFLHWDAPAVTQQ